MEPATPPVSSDYVDLMNENLNTLDPAAIPDLQQLSKQILKILEFIETPAIAKLEREDPERLKTLLFRCYRDTVPFNIIKLLVEPDKYEHLERLLDMFAMLQDVKDGVIDIKDAHIQFFEQLNEKYLYPAFKGGKDEFLAKVNKNPKARGKIQGLEQLTNL